MASITWEVGSDANVMTTELNSLADGSSAISGEIDNSNDLYLFDDVEINTASIGSARDNGATVELFLIPEELDGTGYSDGNAATEAPHTALVGIYSFRATATQQIHVLRKIPLPPSKFKYLVKNETGQSFAASGNTVRRRPYRYSTT